MACKNAIIKSKGRLNLAINFLINNSKNLKKNSLKESFLICRRNKKKNKAVAILIATETEFVTQNEIFKKLANIILEVALFGKNKNKILKYQILNKFPLFKIVNYFSNHIFNESIELKTIVFLEAPFLNFYIHHSWQKAALVGFSDYIPNLEQISKNLAIQLVCNTNYNPSYFTKLLLYKNIKLVTCLNT
ncbi:hypothetical protein [Candidatus Karelsulcia muelleri]|uniref:hypothetical protein n=1 Tax=Candidatus Karelsulcia muelleri TaxID=336810 RepID=UPI00194EFD52|nr:hypothetical protein [Candidatus Karelsulcia muelleri]